jgi:hypothetical protein
MEGEKMHWKVKVFKTNYNTIGAYVEKETDEGVVTIYLKGMPVHGHDNFSMTFCSDGPISECSHCKAELLKKANFVASTLNLNTDEVEVEVD